MKKFLEIIFKIVCAILILLAVWFGGKALIEYLDSTVLGWVWLCISMMVIGITVMIVAGIRSCKKCKKSKKEIKNKEENKSSKVVNMPQTQQVRMVISQPTTFEQSDEICSFLKEKKSVIAPPKKGIKDSTVLTGLKLLNQLFPQSGFDKLDEHPDMYPYFQPLYNFDDGFNVLSPENPIQVIMVLQHIIEDCFQGCRNIKFKYVKYRIYIYICIS